VVPRRSRALRCSGPESVAICIECCYQNTALAITVAVSVFEPKEAALATLVPLFYGGIEIAVIAAFAFIAWQANWTYAPRTDNIFKCIAGNYQPDHQAAEGHSHVAVSELASNSGSAGSGNLSVADIGKALDPTETVEPGGEAQRKQLLDSLHSRKQALDEEVTSWAQSYERRMGRRPTAQDRSRDPDAAELSRRLERVISAIERYEDGTSTRDMARV